MNNYEGHLKWLNIEYGFSFIYSLIEKHNIFYIRETYAAEILILRYNSSILAKLFSWIKIKVKHFYLYNWQK